MEISRLCVVALTWRLQDSLGDELDRLDEPVEFLVGGQDLLAVIEDALQGHAAGAQLDLAIEPEQGFGDFDDQLILLEDRRRFPPDIEEGMRFDGSALPAGCNPDAPREVVYTVTDLYPDHVVLDGNHPLAGMGLRLHLQVVSVRAATPEEAGQGSAGPGFFRLATGPVTPDPKHLH